MLREEFYNGLRGSKAFPKLTEKQVEGMDLILDVWGQWYAEKHPIEFLSAILTEIHHETGGRMQPVMETYASTAVGAAHALELAYLKGQLPWVKQRYWAADTKGLIWIGRGDIQITHKSNYSKQRKNFKETFKVDIPLDENPELAMHPVVSAIIAIEGIIKGMFTAHSLEEFFKDGEMDYEGQRRTVNGDFNDDTIAAKMKSSGRLFEKTLKTAKADEGIEVIHVRALPGSTPSRAKPTEADANAPKQKTKGEERILDIQERLVKLGFGDTVGKPDGKFGPKTASGIEAFEASNNIKLDHIDAATWSALQKLTAEEE